MGREALQGEKLYALSAKELKNLFQSSTSILDVGNPLQSL
jgi:hypothetical protein